MLRIILIVMVCIMFGCTSGKTCIKVGGSYEGVDGNIEYCYEPEQSKAIGMPCFTTQQGLGVMLTEAQANKLMNQFPPVTKDTESKPGIYRIAEILKQRE